MKSTAQVTRTSIDITPRERASHLVATMRRVQPEYQENIRTLEAAGRERALTKGEQSILSLSQKLLSRNRVLMGQCTTAFGAL